MHSHNGEQKHWQYGVIHMIVTIYPHMGFHEESGDVGPISQRACQLIQTTQICKNKWCSFLNKIPISLQFNTFHGSSAVLCKFVIC